VDVSVKVHIWPTKNTRITYVINCISPYISLSKRCSIYDKIFSTGNKNRIEMIVGNNFTVTVITSQKFIVHAISIQRVQSLPKNHDDINSIGNEINMDGIAGNK
jgi:hypothetical protein